MRAFSYLRRYPEQAESYVTDNIWGERPKKADKHLSAFLGCNLFTYSLLCRYGKIYYFRNTPN